MRELDDGGVPPEAFEAVVFPLFRVEDVHQEVAVIAEDPFGVVVAFHAVREFSCLLLHLQGDFVPDGLDLGLVLARADEEEIGEGGDFPEVEDLDVPGLLGLGGAEGDLPRGGLGGGKNAGPGIECVTQSRYATSP